MDINMLVAIIAVGVAGLAAVVGIWMERDHSKPPRWAYALSLMIVLATLVSIVQTYLDAKDSEKMEEDMARMLQTLDKLAAESEDPNLKQFLSTELAAQSRSNPEVVEKLAQRVTDEGGDPTEVIGKHLPASEVNRMARSGKLKTEKPKVAPPKIAATPAPAKAGEGKLSTPVKMNVGMLGKPAGNYGTDSSQQAGTKPVGIRMMLPGSATGATSTDEGGATPSSGGASLGGLRLGGLGGKTAEDSAAKSDEPPATGKAEGGLVVSDLGGKKTDRSKTEEKKTESPKKNKDDGKKRGAIGALKL